MILFIFSRLLNHPRSSATQTTSNFYLKPAPPVNLFFNFSPALSPPHYCGCRRPYLYCMPLMLTVFVIFPIFHNIMSETPASLAVNCCASQIDSNTRGSVQIILKYFFAQKPLVFCPHQRQTNLTEYLRSAPVSAFLRPHPDSPQPGNPASH